MAMTKHGLVNGANGFVRDIIYSNDGDTTAFPIVVLVEFENYTGPKFFDSADFRHNWIPINQITLFCKIVNGSRTQFPLRLAYALTIHKSQGQTLDKVIIDLGKKEMSLGITFVALSRVRKFTDFLIKPFCLDRLIKIKNSIMLKPRQDEEKRIENLITLTLSNFYFLYKE